MITLPRFLALSLAAAAVAPDLVSAAIFPENTLVKMLDHKSFKAALKENVRVMIFAWTALSDHSTDDVRRSIRCTLLFI